MATKSAGAEEMKLGIDFDKFEEEVEKEIDEMFVPFVNEAPEKEGEEAAPLIMETESAKPAFDEPSTTGSGSAAESRPLDLPPLTMETEASVSFDLPSDEKSEADEVEELLNAFNVAYLSLDWDFTAENLSSLSFALERLEPYCQKQQQTSSLYKVLKAVIHRLSSKPDAASASFTEIIRSGQDLLQCMLRSKAGPSASEKEELRLILKQVQLLKEQTAPKAAAKIEEPLLREQKPPVVEQAARATEPVKAPDMDIQAPSGLSDWVDNYKKHFYDALEHFQEESRRLLLLEEILEKKPALAPLTSRLNKIRSSLDMHIESFRKKESEMLDGLQLFCQLDGISVEASGEEAMLGDLNGMGDGEKEGLTKSLPISESEMQREQVCMFSVADKRLGVSASHVVKTEKISAGKLKKIMGRGYATLSDFKPLFKDLRTGVYGAWIGLPTDVLKGFRFVPLSRETLGASVDNPSEARRAILVSNGRQHGMILTESDAIDLQNEMVCKSACRDGLLGIVGTDETSSVEILDLDSILKKVCRE